MTVLGQGSTGLALMMCFALLSCRLVNAAVIMLAVQSSAVALTAVVLDRPLLAIPPLALGAAVWLIQRRSCVLEPWSNPKGGAPLAVILGVALAVLCQSLGGLALPSAILLLAILLAATRSHPMIQVVAVVSAQNGIVLAGCLVAQPDMLTAMLLPAACLFLPLPIIAGLLSPTCFNPRATTAKSSTLGLRFGAASPAWVDLGLAVAVVAATLFIPLDPLAAMFAPLLGLDGVARCWANRIPARARSRNDAALTNSAYGVAAEEGDSSTGGGRTAIEPLDATPAGRGRSSAMHRALTLGEVAFAIVAVATTHLLIAWLGVLVAMGLALPAIPARRRQTSAVLACLAAALGLFGILLLPSSAPLPGYLCLFLGSAMVAAVVPDLAVVVVILLLRLATQATWPTEAAMLGTGIAASAMIVCAILLTKCLRSQRETLLLLSQASIAALALCASQPEGRFAALVLLVLLILTRAAGRIAEGLAAAVATAGLGGIPPLGVFPGLVLVVLALSARDPWLLVLLGMALISTILVSVPQRLSTPLRFSPMSSVAWLPLLAAVVIGYFAPAGLVHWWRILTAPT